MSKQPGGFTLTNIQDASSQTEIVPKRAEEKSRQTPTPVNVLAQSAVNAILEKKGRDILVLDVHDISGVADIFILATGDSELQIKAIFEEIREELREKCGERPWHVEGTEHLQWVLLDYVDLVVHIFSEEKRTFYSLERLWGDAPKEEVPETGSGESVALLA